jgi:hypothetical protein
MVRPKAKHRELSVAAGRGDTSSHRKAMSFLRTKAVIPSKLSGASRAEPNEELTAVVKVSEDGYVPQGVTCRARIGERIFTATLLASELQRLEGDPLVVSVESSRRLRSL